LQAQAGKQGAKVTLIEDAAVGEAYEAGVVGEAYEAGVVGEDGVPDQWAACATSWRRSR
jgi:hypothetical protein